MDIEESVDFIKYCNMQYCLHEIPISIKEKFGITFAPIRSSKVGNGDYVIILTETGSRIWYIKGYT